MTPSPLSPALLEQLLQGRDLSAEQAGSLMQLWLEGAVEPVMTGALLAGLRAKGVSGAELAAMAAVLRDACALPLLRDGARVRSGRPLQR
jgi:anthranilate phosphoribosyltransferase